MTSTTTFSPSGTSSLDQLLTGQKWSSGALTFAFAASDSTLGYTLANSAYFAALTTSEQAAFKSVMAEWSGVANVTFTQVADPSAADITIYWYRDPAGPKAGIVQYPDGTPQGGDIQLGASLTGSDLGQWGSSSQYWAMRAIGAALGLKTPSASVGGFPTASNVYVSNTVMSDFAYAGHSVDQVAEGSYPTSPMLDDIAAIQNLYGANTNAMTANIGDTTYTFSPSAAVIFQAPYDGGGNDTFNFQSYTTNLSVDLRAGGWTDLGGQYAQLDTGDATKKPPGNIVLPSSGGATLIENAYGGSGNDRLVGNSAANILKPGAGNDTLEGGAGADTFDVSSGATGDKRIIDFAEGDVIKLRDVVVGGAITHNNPNTLTTGQVAIASNGMVNVLYVGLDSTPGADLSFELVNGLEENELAVSGQTIRYVTPDVTAPRVASVAVPTAGAYATGEDLTFTVNFDEAVTVTGTPQLAVTIGSTTRQASYVSGSGTSALTFGYAVQSGETDANGIAVGALSLNSGTLKDAAGNDAVLTLNNVASTAAVLVDAVAPTVSAVRPSTSSTTYYKAGGLISVSVTFTEAITVTGTPQLAITVGSTQRQANYVSGSGSTTVSFRYTVQDGDADADGIAVGTLATNGGSLKDAAGNDANLTLNNVSSTANLRVDTTPPLLVSVNATGGQTYKIGDVVRVSVTFDEAMRTQGIPKLGYVLESGTVLTSTYSISGATVTFGYTVQAGDFSDGFQTATAFTLNGVTFGDLASNVVANSLPATTFSTIKIDGVLPTVQSIARVGAAVTKAATQQFTVTFSEAVTGVDVTDFVLTGTGSAAGTVASVTGSGASYTINVSGVTGDGTLRLDLKSSGTGILDTAGNAIATGFTAGQSFTIDNTAPAAPTIAAVATDDTISAGEVSGLTLTGTIEAGASVALTVGGVAKTASVSGTTWSYAVTQADIDAWGAGTKTIAVTATDAVGNVGAAATRNVTISAGALTPEPEPEPEPPRPPSLVDLAGQPAVAFVDLALDSLRITPGSTKTASLTIALPDGTIVPSTAAQVRADVNAATLLFKAGLITQAVFEERLTQAVSPTTGVAHDAYKFFTGAPPTGAGMSWLIDSTDNANDLTDGYYAKFSVENRYINFAVNLGKLGEGRAAFEAQYGALTFEGAVAKAYGEIIGVADAQGAGVDVPAALRYIQSQEAYFRALGGDDLGAKAAMAGFVLSVGTSFHVGKYYEALEDYVVGAIVGQASATTAAAWDLG